MAAFHVFVEGATDESAAGLSRLADAIAKHYGLPAADLLARLQAGRFRVKGNIERAVAENYARDLQKLGARCTIEEATAANSQRTTPIPFPAVKAPVPTPPSGTPTTPSALAGMPSRPSTPSINTPFQSGLSAAFSSDSGPSDLGALGGDAAAFSLSTVDGADDQKGAGGSFGPPAGGLPASIGPAPEKPAGKGDTSAKPANPAKPKDEPLDMFAPPDMQGDEFKVDLAADEPDPRRRASTPPPMEGAPPASSQKLPVTPQGAKPTSGRISQPSIQPPTAAADPQGGTSAPSKFGPLGEPRVRFVAGIVLAILLGFIPAHLIAKMKEDSADSEIDKKVVAAQIAAADSPDSYALLDGMRHDQLERKKSEHRNAAIMGFAVWALVGGGIAFAWFKKIPWE